MFFRFKVRTATGGLSDEFVPKLLDKKNCFMVTVPVGIVKAAGLTEVSTVKLQLIAPASAREAAEAAGKGREFSEAHRKKAQLKGREKKVQVGVAAGGLKAKAPAPAEKPSEAAALPGVKVEVAAPELSGEAAATPPEPKLPEPVGAAQPLEKPLKEAPPGESTEATEGVSVTLAVPAPVTVPETSSHASLVARRKVKVEKKKGVQRRPEVPEDVVSRVRDSVVAMEKKIIYLHLMPQIVLGRLKTRRQIDESVDAVFREVAAAS